MPTPVPCPGPILGGRRFWKARATLSELRWEEGVGGGGEEEMGLLGTDPWGLT